MATCSRSALSDYRTIAVIDASHKVYLVQHQGTGKIYIRKILDVYNAEVYRTLYTHPFAGIPRIIACHEEDGFLDVIEEYISGTTLAEHMQHDALSQADIVSYMLDLCAILEHLHQAAVPIVHRDIKPSNLMVTTYNRIVLLDFNAAKQYHADTDADTVLLGTEGYAAPEQYGFGASTPQTDLYAAGVLLKELLRNSGTEHPALQEIAEVCTRLDPKDRYQSAGELRQALLMGTNPDTGSRTEAADRAADSLLPPGFRTHTPWKMLLAAPGYLLLFWMCLSLQSKTAIGFELWLERFTLLLIGLTIILVSSNYRNLQSILPFSRSRMLPVRVLNAAALILLISAVLILLMLIIEYAL